MLFTGGGGDGGWRGRLGLLQVRSMKAVQLHLIAGSRPFPVCVTTKIWVMIKMGAPPAHYGATGGRKC